MDFKEEEVKYRQEYYDNYGCSDTPYSYNKYYYIHAWILKDFLKIKTVLDVGCAMGFYAGSFQALGIKAEGCDVSRYAINKALPEIREKLKQGNILDLPYRNGEFELVCAFDVLEHLSEEDISKAIKEMRRVSSKYILFTTLFQGEFDHDIKFNADKTHKTSRIKKWWMDIAQIEKYGYIMKPFDYTTPWGIINFPLVDQMIISMKHEQKEEQNGKENKS